MSDIDTFEDLDVWKRGCQLAVDIHVSLADSKDFALRGQMERSSLSIPSNIAEGSERDNTKEFINFLRKRLVFLRELLAEDGSIFFHMDQRKIHYANRNVRWHA